MGAWIEIFGTGCLALGSIASLLVGAWIKISVSKCAELVTRRSLVGAWISDRYKSNVAIVCVAPLVGAWLNRYRFCMVSVWFGRSPRGGVD